MMPEAVERKLSMQANERRRSMGNEDSEWLEAEQVRDAMTTPHTHPRPPPLHMAYPPLVPARSGSCFPKPFSPRMTPSPDPHARESTDSRHPHPRWQENLAIIDPARAATEVVKGKGGSEEASDSTKLSTKAER